MPKSRLVSTRDAARRLAVNQRTIHRMVERGELQPALTVPGYRGAHLFDPAVVEALAVERECERWAAS